MERKTGKMRGKKGMERKKESRGGREGGSLKGEKKEKWHIYARMYTHKHKYTDIRKRAHAHTQEEREKERERGREGGKAGLHFHY